MDYYSDAGHTFAKIFLDYELPPYVKTAEALDSDDLRGLSKTAFADTDHREYPIQDPAQIFTSAAYAFAQPGQVSPEIVSRIEKAAAAFQIQDDVKKMRAHVLSLFVTPGEIKVAAFQAPKKAPFMIKFSSAGIDRLEGVGGEMVKRAEGRFLKLWPEIELERRPKIAADLLAAAGDNDVTLSDETLKMAGRAEIDQNLLRQQFNLRLGRVADSLTKNALIPAFNIKMALLNASRGEADTRAAGMKLVEFLGEMDTNHKMARFYGELLDGPHQAVFNKVASAPELIVVGRHSYPFETWTGSLNLFDEAINQVLGPKAAEMKTAVGEYDLEKLKEIGDEEADLIQRMVG